MFRILILLPALVGMLASFSGKAAASPAAELYREARVAERHGRNVEALIFYSRARALEPANPAYARGARRVRGGAAKALALAGQHRAALLLSADSLLGKEVETASDAGYAGTANASSEQLLAYRGPAKLRYAGHQVALRLRGTLEEAYERVAEEFGLRVIFDESFDGSRPVRADLSECDFACAMRVLGALGSSVAVPLTQDSVLVMDGDSRTRSELEPVAVASIPLRGATTREARSQITQMLRQLLEIEQFHAVDASGIVVARSTPGKLEMAKSLLRDFGHPNADVEIEVSVLSVTNGRDTQMGIRLPTSFPVANLSTLLGAVPDLTGTERMIGLGGGSTQLGVTFGDSSLVASLERDSTRSLQNMRLRTAHGVQAEFKLGERFPIATAQFIGGISVQRGENYVQPPPSVTFEDLGLLLTVTPHVHTAMEVTLEIEVELRLLAGSAVNGVPVLANRQVQSRLRLRQGQFAIISGMSTYESRLAKSGPAGLARIPLLGALFRTARRNWSRRDMLVLVRPRVARLPPGEAARAGTILFGTAERAFVQY